MHLVDEDVIVFALDEMLLNPGVEVVLGLDVLEGLFFLIDVNNVGIWIVIMPLDEILHHIAFAHTTGPNDSYDIAFSNPRVHNISVIPSC